MTSASQWRSFDHFSKFMCLLRLNWQKQGLSLSLSWENGDYCSTLKTFYTWKYSFDLWICVCSAETRILHHTKFLMCSGPSVLSNAYFLKFPARRSDAIRHPWLINIINWNSAMKIDMVPYILQLATCVTQVYKTELTKHILFSFEKRISCINKAI